MTEEEFRHGGLVANPAPVGLPAVSDMAQRADTPVTQPNRGGRPSIFTQAILDEICDRLTSGEPMAKICRDSHMPAERTVRGWIVADEEVSAAIACAREAGFDQIAMDGLAIVDDLEEDAQSRRVRSDYRLKLLAKWDPKRYGDKTIHSNDAENPMPTSIVVQFHD